MLSSESGFSRRLAAAALSLALAATAFNGKAQEAMPGPPPAMPSIKDTQYQSILHIDNDRLTVTGRINKGNDTSLSQNTVSHLSVSNSKADVNPVLVTGVKSNVTIRDMNISSDGGGSNDFLAKGAGLLAAEGIVSIYDSSIETSGVISSALVSAERATLKAFNSHFVSHGGKLPDDYVPVIGPGMKEPPAPLGITGTARTHLTTSNARSYFYNCTFEADGWGALSTDASGGEAYLEVNDSSIKVNNSGYGAYADFGARVVINSSELHSATYTGVIAGAAEMQLNASTSSSGANVMMIHSVMGNPMEQGKLIIEGGKHVSQGTALLIKSANADITLTGTEIIAGDGQLIQAKINDDPHRTRTAGKPVPGSAVTISASQLNGNVINEDSERSLAVSLKAGSSIHGAMQNVTLSVNEDSLWHATEDSTVVITDPAVLDRIAPQPGVKVMATVLSDSSSVPRIIRKENNSEIIVAAATSTKGIL